MADTQPPETAEQAGAAKAAWDEQPTVVSRQPPLSERAWRRAASPREIGQVLAGARLGHFQLEQFVGGGGMGAVFRALDTRLNRTVAVKVLSPQHTDDEALRRFKNEALSAARLDHENIARVYYVGEDDGWQYIVFEYIDGENLRDLVRRVGPLPLADALSYTLQVAQALEHARQRDVIHRDIKPSNVLVTAEGRAKLVDMGLARLYRMDAPEDVTASGVTLGTFDYISPEQARDPRDADIRSDLYSLGCTLYYMLTGSPPFPGGTALQKLLSHTGQSPPDPRRVRPDLDDAVVRILARLLAKNPADRHQRPAELVADLAAAAQTLHLPPPQPAAAWLAPPPKTVRWWARHAPWAAPAVLLLGWAALLRYAAPHSPPLAPPPPRFSAVQLPEPTAAAADPDAAAAPATEPAAPPAPRRILVDAAGAGSSGEALHAASLHEAFQLLDRHASVETIELDYNGAIVEPPLEVADRDLVVRAAPGAQPLVLFRPQPGDPPQAMITLRGGRCRWEGVHFRLEAPAGAPDAGWSLFQLHGVRQLELADATVTVAQPDWLAPSSQPANAVFRVAPEAARNGDGGDAPRPPPLIQLDRCLVRGEATLAKLPEGLPLRLAWRQGLLVLSGRLLDAGGRASPPDRWDDRYDVALTHVTAVLGGGLCRTAVGPEAPYQLEAATRCYQCIFLLAAPAPLIQQVGGAQPRDFLRRPTVSGADNFYVGADVLLELAPGAADGRPLRYAFADREAARAEGWYDEKRAQSLVLWEFPPPLDSPPHGHVKRHYQLDSDPANPARDPGEDGRPAGFDPSLIPDPPDPTPAWAAAPGQPPPASDPGRPILRTPGA